MAALTTHVLNTATGMPAAGMRIELRTLGLGSHPAPIAFVTNEDGRCGPMLQGEPYRAGRYALTFHAAAYFRSLNVTLTEPPFLDEIVISFGIADASRNHHVPLLVSPFSYSTYRGS